MAQGILLKLNISNLLKWLETTHLKDLSSCKRLSHWILDYLSYHLQHVRTEGSVSDWLVCKSVNSENVLGWMYSWPYYRWGWVHTADTGLYWCQKNHILISMEKTKEQGLISPGTDLPNCYWWILGKLIPRKKVVIIILLFLTGRVRSHSTC